MTAGKTSSPTTASTTSATNICTTAITIIATVPTAIGSGAIGPHAASTSELALDSSSPVGWRWCHSIGSERYWRVTARRLCACMRYCMTPAPSRRATMPTARSSATPRNSASTATSSPLPISPFSNAGSSTCWVDQPSTQASATVRAPNSTLPIVESVKTQGSRLIATQMTAEALERGGRSRRLTRLAHRTTLSSSGPARGNRAATRRLFPGADIVTNPLPSRTASVWSVTLTLARRERHALCDTALDARPRRADPVRRLDARDLVAHLLVRENSDGRRRGHHLLPHGRASPSGRWPGPPGAVPGDGGQAHDPGITPYRLPGVERLTNTLEYLVHHEDLRRAQPGWEPRDLPAADEDELWKLLPGAGQAGHPQGRRADRRTPRGPARPGGDRPPRRRPGRGHRAARRSWCCSSSAARSCTT